MRNLSPLSQPCSLLLLLIRYDIFKQRITGKSTQKKSTVASFCLKLTQNHSIQWDFMTRFSVIIFYLLDEVETTVKLLH